MKHKFYKLTLGSGSATFRCQLQLGPTLQDILCQKYLLAVDENSFPRSGEAKICPNRGQVSQRRTSTRRRPHRRRCCWKDSNEGVKRVTRRRHFLKKHTTIPWLGKFDSMHPWHIEFSFFSFLRDFLKLLGTIWCITYWEQEKISCRTRSPRRTWDYIAE